MNRFELEFIRQFAFIPSLGLTWGGKYSTHTEYKYALGIIWLNFRACWRFGKKNNKKG